MSTVETTVSSSVRTIAENIVRSNEYNYYYLYATTQTDCYLIQSKKFIDNYFSDCLVTEFHYVHDDQDHLTDWRMSSYQIQLFTPNNPENYIVYTNAYSNYPVLRGCVTYDTGYFTAGFCVLCSVVASAILFFRIWRINHG